jgi:hypothetical protein
MTLQVELLNMDALNLLIELDRLKLIRFEPADAFKKEKTVNLTLEKTYLATRLDTQHFKFNREEANER